MLWFCKIVDICNNVDKLPNDNRNINLIRSKIELYIELNIILFLENSKRPAIKLFLNRILVNEKKIIVENIIVIFWKDDFKDVENAAFNEEVFKVFSEFVLS